MARYLIRPRLSGQAKAEGKEGASGTVVYVETAAKAREVGAAKLGLRQSQVEVILHGATMPVVGAIGDAPVDPEELKDVMNQETQIVPGSWEH